MIASSTNSDFGAATFGPTSFVETSFGLNMDVFALDLDSGCSLLLNSLRASLKVVEKGGSKFVLILFSVSIAYPGTK